MERPEQGENRTIQGSYIKMKGEFSNKKLSKYPYYWTAFIINGAQMMVVFDNVEIYEASSISPSKHS
jgi:hypothetical protein